MSAPISRNRSFTTVFLIEMWERFGYYGMAALLMLFMVDRAGFDDSRANLTWGAFAALVYAAPSIGGWIGDHVLGARRTMIAGAIVLAAGYLILAIPGERLSQLYLALGVIVVGNGLFKANAANLVRRIYADVDTRLDSAFTIYYMAVNIGSTLSMLLTPWIKDHYGWHAAFAVCCAGMALGLLNIVLMHRTLAHVGSRPDAEPIRWARVGAVAIGSAAAVVLATYVLGHRTLAAAAVWIAAVVVLSVMIVVIARAGQAERAGLFAALVLIVQSLLFFVFYQQMSTSLTLFALRNVDARFMAFGHTLFVWRPAQFQALNPIWIMLLSPLLVVLYNTLAARRIDVSIAAKFAFGFALVSAGFFVFAASGTRAVDGRVSSWFMVWGYGLVSLGELLVSGLGLAVIARYVPARMCGFMMGAYFVATGLSQYVGSMVANHARLPSNDMPAAVSLPFYLKLFAALGWTAAAGTIVSCLLLPLMRHLSRVHRQRASRDTGARAGDALPR